MLWVDSKRSFRTSDELDQVMANEGYILYTVFYAIALPPATSRSNVDVDDEVVVASRPAFLLLLLLGEETVRAIIGVLVAGSKESSCAEALHNSTLKFVAVVVFGNQTHSQVKYDHNVAGGST